MANAASQAEARSQIEVELREATKAAAARQAEAAAAAARAAQAEARAAQAEKRASQAEAREMETTADARAAEAGAEARAAVAEERAAEAEAMAADAEAEARAVMAERDAEARVKARATAAESMAVAKVAVAEAEAEARAAASEAAADARAAAMAAAKRAMGGAIDVTAAVEEETRAAALAAAKQAMKESPRHSLSRRQSAVSAGEVAAAAAEMTGGNLVGNWELLADRAIAVGGKCEPPPARNGPAMAVTRPVLPSDAEARRVLADACAMLRVRHTDELIAVLGQVVRVAVMVPQLEQLRDVLPREAMGTSKPLDRASLLAALKQPQRTGDGCDVAASERKRDQYDSENVDLQTLRGLRASLGQGLTSRS